LPIRQNAFDPVAGLDFHPTVVDGQQNHHPIIGTPLPDPPAVEEGGDILFWRHRRRGMHDNHRDLGRRLLFHLRYQGVQLRLGRRV
jgi:hypothetical protein